MIGQASAAAGYSTVLLSPCTSYVCSVSVVGEAMNVEIAECAGSTVWGCIRPRSGSPGPNIFPRSCAIFGKLGSPISRDARAEDKLKEVRRGNDESVVSVKKKWEGISISELTEDT